MAKNKNSIKSCRYYHGEASCPFSENLLCWFWDMERVFVKHNGIFEGESDLYKAIGGKDFPGIPHDLLTVMFTSWCKSAYDAKASLPEFYSLMDDYLDIASDYFPIDKVPS